MKLSHPLFSEPITFTENKINVLVIENKSFLTKLIYELFEAHSGFNNGFVLSKQDEPVSFSSVDIITDLFNIELNIRRNITKLLTIMAQTAMEEENYINTCKIKGEIECYTEYIADKLPYNLQISEVNAQDIFKICNIEFSNDSNDICDTLLTHFNIYGDLLGTKLFILINLHQFVTDDKLKVLYKEIIYSKYNVLLIETSKSDFKSECESYKIIDNDLCEIT